MNLNRLEVLWDGLPPADYVAALVAYNDHPQKKLLDMIHNRLKDASVYVGLGAYAEPMRAIEWLRGHAILDTAQRRHNVEWLKDFLEPEEYELIRCPPDIEVLLAHRETILDEFWGNDSGINATLGYFSKRTTVR